MGRRLVSGRQLFGSAPLFLRTPRTAFLAALLISTAGCNITMESGGDSSASGGGGAPVASANAEITPQALQAAARDEPVRRFYEARQWQAAWNEERGAALTQTLQGAVRHGLDPAMFAGEISSGGDAVTREVAMTRAALSYADALARGRTDPARLVDVYTLPRPEADTMAGLARAVEGGDLAAFMDGLAPQDEEYRALGEAFVAARQASQPQPQGGPAGNSASGNASAAVMQGNSAAPAAQPKAKTNRRATGAESPPAERAIALAVNMERRRWLAREAPGTRIDVNTAATFLQYYRDGTLANRRAVVVGEPGWETPQLGSPIFRLVANPNWTVPTSIEGSELSQLSEAQLRQRNISRRDGNLVQEPGPRNALGLVKFDMQNNEAIYLHDTPSKGAFGAERRHLSHGCVRVQDAVGFARLLAEHDGKLDQFNQALSSGDTTMVPLSNQVPVRLLYHTAYLDEGQLRIRPDVYGWDARVARALGYDVVVPPPVERRQGGGDGP